MKREFSAIELHYLINEMKTLEGSKVDRIYQPKKEELLLQLHKTGEGRRLLRIVGRLFYLTEHKPENPKKPFGFCAYLRKKLSGSMLSCISQSGSERVVDISFQAREEPFNMFLELFGAGNIILTDSSRVILSSLRKQKFQDREVKPGEKYTHPTKPHNIFSMGRAEFEKALKDTAEQSIVKALAIDLGAGGTYAEEMCLLSGIDKSTSPASLSADDIAGLKAALDSLTSREADPVIMVKDSEVIDITPFPLKIHEDYEKKRAESYNKALDSVITSLLSSIDKAEKQKEEGRGAEKLRKSIEAQEKSIKKLKKDAGDSQRKGEMIYENYMQLKGIVEELRKAREKHTWKEIKEKLKGHKTVKEINEKEGRIVVEL